ncbi:MAG: RecQ family zinc-binding domain-containing protein [Saprospiraceae bacterium]
MKTFSCLKLLEQEGWIVLTEAVYLPSTFKVKVNREQLYDFQLKHKQLDIYVKTLLRLTEGAFQHYAKINENAMARFLKIPVKKWWGLFISLTKKEIIDYNPAKDKPQIIFIHERIGADDLTIDKERFEARKRRQKERIEKATGYATTQRCRSQQLLEYFDEQAPTCGICDVCLKNKETELTKDDYERYQSKIQALLKKEKLTEQELLESFSSNRHASVLATLSHLMDEGFIDKEGDQIIWKKS